MSLSVELPKKEKAAGLSLSMSPLHKRCIPSRRRPLCNGLYPLGCEPKQTLSLKLLFGVYFISIWKGTNTEAKLFFFRYYSYHFWKSISSTNPARTEVDSILVNVKCTVLFLCPSQCGIPGFLMLCPLGAGRVSPMGNGSCCFIHRFLGNGLDFSFGLLIWTVRMWVSQSLIPHSTVF